MFIVICWYIIKFIIVVVIVIFSLHQFPIPWLIKKVVVGSRGSDGAVESRAVEPESWFMSSYSNCVSLDNFPWYSSISGWKNFLQKAPEGHFLRPDFYSEFK